MDPTSWMTIYPEIVLLVMACVIALVDLAVKSPRRTATHVLTLLTLGGVAWLNASYALADQTLYGWGRLVVSDPLGVHTSLMRTLPKSSGCGPVCRLPD